MRWSQAFIPTLRDAPSEADAISHRLLVRAGFIRQLSAGHYSMLPLGQRVRLKVTSIIREEMNRIGGQEAFLPAILPAELLRRSGRLELFGEELFRFKDRKQADIVLGMTHEEVFATIATEFSSYRQLPQIWYQIQTKFRDEPRPKGGLLRVREFTMKDSYSLDLDRQGLDAAFDLHHGAYLRIFRKLGLDAVDVEASSGAMGGSDSVEFMVRSSAGEDLIVTCASCGYRANIQRATSRVDLVEDPEPVMPAESFPTPGLRTIAALAAAFPEEAAPSRQIKTLVYILDSKPLLVLMRGDHNLQEQKLADHAGASQIRPAVPEEIPEMLGASPGSLGAVGVKNLTIIADDALKGRKGMITGANRDDFHLRNTDVERDIDVDRFLDLREVGDGEPCARCGEPLELWKGIEVGHIFKLGTRYSEAMGAIVQDEKGRSLPIVMGCYGIGVERAMAAIVEASHDEKGIIWPVVVAPFEAVVTMLRADNPDVVDAAEGVYSQLTAAGVETLIDDRDERPGVKFADAELVGIPYRIAVGPKGVAAGTVELTTRRGMTTENVAMGEAAARVADLVNRQR